MLYKGATNMSRRHPNFGTFLKNLKKNADRIIGVGNQTNFINKELYKYGIHGVTFYVLCSLIREIGGIQNNRNKPLKYKTIKKIGKAARKKTKLLLLSSVMHIKDPREWTMIDDCSKNKDQLDQKQYKAIWRNIKEI
jgi:hypothetical protein